MARVKSIIERALVDRAKKAHNCQASAKHRIKNGDKRLKVRNGRSWDHYCIKCAQNIVKRDMIKLRELSDELHEEEV